MRLEMTVLSTPARLDVVSVTEHNTVLPSFAARIYSKATDGPVVVTGEEVTTARFHVQ